MQATVGLAIKSCDAKPSVVISANIPSSGIKNWSATFEDQTEHVIPGWTIIIIVPQFLMMLTAIFFSIQVIFCQDWDRDICKSAWLPNNHLMKSSSPCHWKDVKSTAVQHLALSSRSSATKSYPADWSAQFASPAAPSWSHSSVPAMRLASSWRKPRRQAVASALEDFPGVMMETVSRVRRRSPQPPFPLTSLPLTLPQMSRLPSTIVSNSSALFNYHEMTHRVVCFDFVMANRFGRENVAK